MLYSCYAQMHRSPHTPITIMLRCLIRQFISRSEPNNSFSLIPSAPLDPIFGVTVAFNQDRSPQKINLGVGAYRDHQGKPYKFKVVRKAEEIIFKANLNNEYLPIDGLATFISGARRLILGSESEAIKTGRVASSQSISGTGALNLGFSLLAQFMPSALVYISDPTWLNHKNLIDYVRLKWTEYPYYHTLTKGFDFDGMINCLQQAAPGSVILLHACAHNPTGVDPTKPQWIQIASTMKKRNLIPFFDCAYQGFATGDLEEDNWAIKYFVSEGFQMLIAQSFAKSMGLYGERIGAFHVVAADKPTADKILSQIKIIVRKVYSNPSLHGALVAEKLLTDPQLFENWRTELRETVSARIISMRHRLRKQLEVEGGSQSWAHITNQIGMFSYTGLNAQQCELLTNKYHVYLLKSGRISMAGVNETNVKYLAASIRAVVAETGK